MSQCFQLRNYAKSCTISVSYTHLDVYKRQVKYKVDLERLDEFFSALSCGIVYKTCKTSLPENYSIGHIYHNFVGQTDPTIQAIETEIEKFYSGNPMDFMSFGEPGTKN